MDTTDLRSGTHLTVEDELAIFAPPLSRARADPATAAGLVALFASTLFLGAFLVFLAQPILAKMVLPLPFSAQPSSSRGCRSVNKADYGDSVTPFSWR